MSRRRSKSTPLPRNVGPLAPRATASSAVIRATPLVRIPQMGFPVSRFSYSSTFAGKRLANCLTGSKKPSGGAKAGDPLHEKKIHNHRPPTHFHHHQIDSEPANQKKKY